MGNNPSAIAITPDQAPTAAFTSVPGSPGSPTHFDASASVSPVGSIASYAWKFGDGDHGHDHESYHHPHLRRLGVLLGNPDGHQHEGTSHHPDLHRPDDLK